ncbi:MAG: M50 family peptidase [Chloroflexi bacterium]|nr:MAG: M50 family peptidase [Chloroflexota bacterium]
MTVPLLSNWQGINTDRKGRVVNRLGEKRPSWLVSLWGGLFNLIIYAIFGLVMWNFNRLTLYARLYPNGSLFARLERIALALTVILLATSAVHELGHLLAGRLAGLRFHILEIGPLRVTREGGQLKIGWNRGMLFSGMAASVPGEGVLSNLRGRMLAFALGGPLASLLMAIVAAVLFWWWQGRLDLRTQAWMLETAAMTAILSFVFFMTAMKPGRYQNGLSADGDRIVSLIQGGPAATRWCALVALNGTDLQGIRPKLWDEQLVHQAMMLQDASYDTLTARLMGYQWALDNGHIVQAAAWLDEALENWQTWSVGQHARLVLEKAYLLARFEKDAENGRFWYEKIPAHRLQTLWKFRAHAAILLAEGNSSAALQEIHTGLARLASMPKTGTNIAEKNWLEELKQIAETAVS